MNNDKLTVSLIAEAKEYWKSVFSEELERTSLASQYIKSINGFNKHSFRISGELFYKLEKITKGNYISIYTFLVTVLKIQLYKYTSQSNLLIGIPVYFKSNKSETANKIIPFKTIIDENNTFKEQLIYEKNRLEEIYRYQIYSIDEIVRRKDTEESNTRYSINIAMKNIHNIIHIDYMLSYENSEINFLIDKKEDYIDIELIYNLSLLNEEFILKFSEVYLKIFSGIIFNLQIPLKNIDILSDEEKRKILVEFNDTKADYPKDKTIYELFEDQVEKTPDNIAVVYEEKELSYRELNKRANQLARVLREKGVGPDKIVGIMVEQSLEMIIGIMGVLKAGGAYLPIDTEYPVDRIGYMLEDSKTNILLTQTQLAGKIEFHGDIIYIDKEDLYEGDSSNLKKINKPSHLVYIIYTSGSTGKPKGVMIEHRSLVNRLNWMQNKYPIGNEDIILQKTPITFDVSVWELFWWSIQGSTLVVLPHNLHKNPEAIVKSVNENKVTVIHFVPSMLNVFLEYLENKKDNIELTRLKRVFVSGEALLLKQLNAFSKNFAKLDAQLYNLYGPTEATVDVTFFDCLKDVKLDNIPIGKPIYNIRMYIVDKNSKLQPVGVSGELCISGDGLARGYLNRPELTKEKFVQNPYEPGERMYKTGDLARWLPDGNIEFIGRIDHQVKIRGFRIELGEIESQLLKHEDVKEAVVIDREDKEGNKYLCTYVVSNKEITVTELREHLSKELPDYMVPAYFMGLETIPLTPNGKIDRKSLPEPNGDINTGVEYVAPRNEIEEKIVKIWSKVIGIEKIGIDDNFFALGGHSLKGIQVVSIIHRVLNAELSVSQLFNTPTIRQLGRYIDLMEKKEFEIIKRLEEKEYYEASEAQKRIYMLQSFDGDSVAYNMPTVLEVLGDIEIEKVQKAFEKLIERHEILRTSFKLIDDKIVQKIHKCEDINFEFYTVELMDKIAINNYIKNFIKVFDLEKAPLLRGGIIRVSEEKHILLYDMHHINSDATSMTILIEEFWMLYEDKDLEKLEVQYKDYSAWQNKIYNSNNMKMQEEYWLSKFKGDLPRLELPIDYPRSSMLDFNGDSYDFEIKEELLKRLREICKNQNITLFTMLFSAYNIILSKITNQEKIIVGVPVNCRNYSQLEKMIGMFLNTIAIRNQPEKNIIFKEFLNEVNKNIIDGMENQDYQFEMLIEKLNVSRELNRTPIFDTIMNFVSVNEKSNFNNKLKITPFNSGVNQAKFDITMYVYDLEDSVKISCNYRTALFKRETIEYLMMGFLNLLDLISQDIEKNIKEYNIFSKKDIVSNKNRLTISDSYERFLKEEINESIIKRFENVVNKYPSNIAIKTNKNTITYNLLNKRVNKMSQSILKSMAAINKQIGDNIKPQTVALLCNHDIEMIVAMLGALRTGVIFVPLDPTYPTDRLIYMLKNSEATILISDNFNITLAETLRECLDKNIAICEIDGDIADEKCSIKVEAEQIAYIMYTSGSTGEPKGVIQTNENVLAFICGYTNEFNINEKDKITLLSSYSHTTGIIDIFSALLNGATLCPYDIKSEGNMDNLVKYIEDEEITIYHSVPSVYRYYMNCIDGNKNSTLRLIILGGESLYKSDVDLYKKNFADNCMFVNLFGSSEVIVATSYLINKETEIESNIVPIGYLVDNVECHIINENGEEEPVYGVGEIVYSSKYLAKGYWNLEDKTEEVFVNNPITKNGIAYRSGDIGRILPNGRLEYLGRADYQVKIRGYRVEVSEVESVLDKIDAIEKSVVIAYEKELGEKYLAAYYVVKDGEELNLDSIKDELKNTLPSYMIPLCFKEIKEIPLTPNGKIHKKALPKLDLEITSKEYVAPTNEIEEKLVAIWKDILNMNNIGIDDNFFDLGGHSLKATLLVGRIYKEFNVKMELKDIFTYITVREISQLIKSKEKIVYEAIEKLETQNWYETSSAQKRMYLLHEVDNESIAYNIPYVMEVIGKIDVSKIKESFLKLIERHESLRTSFKLINGKVMQKIHDYEDMNFEFDIVELVNDSDINIYAKNFTKVFDLEKAPLLRAGIIRVSEEKHMLLWDIHHIVCDGTSMEIFMTEFWKVYRGKELESLDIQYKDYSAWQAKKKESKEFRRQEEYWLQEFSGEIPILKLPTDYLRPELKSFEGDSISFVLDKVVTSKLIGIAKETGSTMYMVLLASINILLSKYSDQDEIVIGTTIAGRNHRDLEKIIGMFVNTLAIKSTVDNQKSFNEYVKNIKEKTLRAYENQDYQFEELVEILRVKRDLSRNPLFDVMFSLQNMDRAEVLANSLTLKSYIQGNTISKFDISIIAEEFEECIGVKFEYCTKLFKKQTIQKMSDHFINIINEITSKRYVKLADILLLNKDQLKEFKNEIEDSNHNIEFDF